MRLLVGIKSCQRDRMRGCHQTIRDTWGKDLGSIALRFFMGGNGWLPEGSWEPDETVIQTPDDYDSLALKTQAICKWAVDQPLDYLFLADTDCCVWPNNLRNCNYQNYDYMGRFNGICGDSGPRSLVFRTGDPEILVPNCHSWASGGGYFLSRKAFIAVAEAPPPEIYGFAEDAFVGQIMGNLKMKSKAVHIRVCKYYLSKEGHSKGYDPKSGWMRKTYDSPE